MTQTNSKSFTLKAFLIVATLLVQLSACNLKKDKEAPIIRLNGPDTSIVTIGNQYIDLGAIVFDHEDLDISSELITTGFVDTDSVGQYEIQYSAHDQAGNVANSKRIVLVIESNYYLMGMNYTATSSCFSCPIDVPGIVSNCSYPDCPRIKVSLFANATQFHMSFNSDVNGLKLKVRNQVNTIICHQTRFILLGGDGRISLNQDSLFFNLSLEKGNSAELINCNLVLYR